VAVGDIRWTVRSALVDGLRAHPAFAGVQVEHGWPGDTLEVESVWLDSSDGDLEVPNFHGPATATNPVTHDDLFVIPVEIQAGRRGKDMVAAQARCQTMTNAVEAVVRTDPTLQSTDGLMWMTIRRMRGPSPVWTKEGVVCFARLEIEGKARMDGVP
jgi:hypothetical protein